MATTGLHVPEATVDAVGASERRTIRHGWQRDHTRRDELLRESGTSTRRCHLSSISYGMVWNYSHVHHRDGE